MSISQNICSVSTLLCFARNVPLWIIAILGLILLSLGTSIRRTVAQGREKKTN